MKNSLWIYLGLFLVLFITGCSSNSAVTVDINSFSQDEKNDLQKEAFQSLDSSMQNEIINWEQADVSTFKTDDAFEVFNKNTDEAIVIKDLQTILVTFNGKEESLFQSIEVYLDENDGNTLGYLTEDK